MYGNQAKVRRRATIPAGGVLPVNMHFYDTTASARVSGSGDGICISRSIATSSKPVYMFFFFFFAYVGKRDIKN